MSALSTLNLEDRMVQLNAKLKSGVYNYQNN